MRLRFSKSEAVVHSWKEVDCFLLIEIGSMSSRGKVQVFKSLNLIYQTIFVPTLICDHELRLIIECILSVIF